jgi:predicted RNA-binding protein with PUA domain
MSDSFSGFAKPLRERKRIEGRTVEVRKVLSSEDWQETSERVRCWREENRMVGVSRNATERRMRRVRAAGGRGRQERGKRKGGSGQLTGQPSDRGHV